MVISESPQNSLKHRPPFVWVSRLLERNLNEKGEGVSGVVELDLDAANPIFSGHFPGEPLFPGVLQIEAGAQACLWILLGHQEVGFKVPDGYLLGIEEYKFRGFVKPPQTLRLQCQRIKKKSWLEYWTIEASVDGKVCSSGSLWMGLNPPSKKEQA